MQNIIEYKENNVLEAEKEEILSEKNKVGCSRLFHGNIHFFYGNCRQGRRRAG